MNTPPGIRRTRGRLTLLRLVPPEQSQTTARFALDRGREEESVYSSRLHAAYAGLAPIGAFSHAFVPMLAEAGRQRVDGLPPAVLTLADVLSLLHSPRREMQTAWVNTDSSSARRCIGERRRAHSVDHRRPQVKDAIRAAPSRARRDAMKRIRSASRPSIVVAALLALGAVMSVPGGAKAAGQDRPTSPHRLPIAASRLADSSEKTRGSAAKSADAADARPESPAGSDVRCTCHVALRGHS
jgi:hypothetical protein